MIKRGKEEFSGYNKPKATPSHPTKSHVVLAKAGDEVKLIRFGQQGATGSPDGTKRNEAFKARHAKNRQGQDERGVLDQPHQMVARNNVISL